MSGGAQPARATPAPDLVDVLAGLASSPRTLPCRLFYDETGARLFEQISELPEYYLTRSELALMRRESAAIAAALGARCRIVEPGSGSAHKSRLLLRLLERPLEYVPVDVSRAQLAEVAHSVAAEFPGLRVTPLVADFAGDFSVPAPSGDPARTVVYFPGSTIGNFSPAEAVEFLRRMAQLAGAGGGLLVGVDTPKAAARLELAYDDPAGVTAAFNRNILAHVNRIVGADFDPQAFRHEAVWQDEAGRIELRLVSAQAQRVRLGSYGVLELAAGEVIVTEHCHKYHPRGFQRLARDAGLRPAAYWLEPEHAFTLHWLEVPPVLGTRR
jgi:dimethylhistidine N-methyltransferase